jgi:hypothetical protein
MDERKWNSLSAAKRSRFINGLRCMAPDRTGAWTSTEAREMHALAHAEWVKEQEGSRLAALAAKRDAEAAEWAALSDQEKKRRHAIIEFGGTWYES